MKNIITNLCLLILAGCSGQNNSNPGSQVLAKVNSYEITTDALRSELKGSKQSLDDRVAAKRVLSGLIDRQLLVQEAFKFDLEHVPEIVQAIESAKAKIYAQAYLAKKLTKISPPSDDDVEKFIESHPDKFRHRKVFKMQDVIFSNDASLLDLQSIEKEVLTLKDLQALLTAKDVNYETGHSEFFTDRLPDEVLDKIKPMKKGDLLFLHNSNNIIVKSVEDIIEQPLSEKHSRLFAGRLLNQQRQQEFIAQEIARLKALSKIEILDTELNTQLHAVNY